MKNKKKRTFIKIEVTPEEHKIILEIFGPSGRVSGNILMALLNPGARRNPDQWRAFIKTANTIEGMLSAFLKSCDRATPADICDFIRACVAARELLQALDRHAP